MASKVSSRPRSLLSARSFRSAIRSSGWNSRRSSKSNKRSRMTLNEFRRIRARIQPYVRTTPIVPSEIQNVFLKLENLQHTHAFKIRGAFAHILELVEAGDERTLLTVSAGNHGQAVARAASTFHLSCTVVVPA